MKVGQKVKLKRYKDYGNTKTEDWFSYTDTMERMANTGVELVVRSIDGDGGVRLKSSNGLTWVFHVDDVIFNIKLENK